MRPNSPKDPDQAARRRLLEGFDEWAGDDGAGDDVLIAFDYKQAAGEHRFHRWKHEDIDGLFLDFLPAKSLMSPDEAVETATMIGQFFEYLEVTGRMSKSSDPAADLIDHIGNHMDEYLELVADPDSGGPSKRILMAMMADGVDVEDLEQTRAWVAALNAGPIEDRDAILGPSLDFDDKVPEIVLPHRMEVDIELARRSAQDAPILAKFRALASYLGEGRRLTDRGNLKLADARALVDLLETGDQMETEVGDRVFKERSSANLVCLDMVVWWARQVGVVKVRDKRMSMTKTWQKRASDPLAAMGQTVDVVFETGPLVMLLGDHFYDDLYLVMDVTTVALMAKVYEEDQSVEEFIEMMTQTMPSMTSLPSYHFGGLVQGEEPYLKESVRTSSQRMVRVLEMAGLLVWNDGTLVDDRWGSDSVWHGGVLSITPFGEWVVQNTLTDSGMLIAPVLVPLTVDLDDPPDEIVTALAEIVPAGPESLAQAWDALGGSEGLPEQLWRVDSPQTEILLEALGHTLPDKATAKAARKALLKHRSWAAGRSGAT